MTNPDDLRFRKGDMLAVILVAALAVAVAVCFLPQSTSKAEYAQVYHNAELVKTLSLNEDCTFAVEGIYTNTITVQDGSIAITASDCPGEDCVHSGAIKTAGRSLVCLPNGVEVRVITQNSDVDFVVG